MSGSTLSDNCAKCRVFQGTLTTVPNSTASHIDNVALPREVVRAARERKVNKLNIKVAFHGKDPEDRVYDLQATVMIYFDPATGRKSRLNGI